MANCKRDGRGYEYETEPTIFTPPPKTQAHTEETEKQEKKSPLLQPKLLYLLTNIR